MKGFFAGLSSEQQKAALAYRGEETHGGDQLKHQERDVRAHFKFYRVGPSWVLSLGAPKFGLIHLGSPYWWRLILQFPFALWAHCRSLALRQGEPR